MLDKLKKWICRIVRPSLAASLEPWARLQNLARFNLCIGITLVDVHMNWRDWFHTHSLMLYGCLCQRFLPCTARVWNSFPAKCFLLTFDLNGYKSEQALL